MGSDAERSMPKAVERSISSKPSGPAQEDRQLEINVIFTTPKGTMAALKAAQELAHDLDAQTVLLVPQVVPLQFPISSPPVSIAFTQRRAYALAMDCQKDGDIRVQVYLCGDRRKCLLKVLKPQSLVLVGGKKHWWPAPEQRLVKALRADGHKVIFVNGK